MKFNDSFLDFGFSYDVHLLVIVSSLHLAHELEYIWMQFECTKNTQTSKVVERKPDEIINI